MPSERKYACSRWEHTTIFDEEEKVKTLTLTIAEREMVRDLKVVKWRPIH